MKSTNNIKPATLAILLVILGGLAMVSRLIPHLPNFTPITAITIFAGVMLAPSSRWFVLLPVGLRLISDLMMGVSMDNITYAFYPDQPFVLLSYLMIFFIGSRIRQVNLGSSILTGVGASVLFFIVTNFGVWATGTMYPHTAAGLWTCFVKGIEFYRNTFISDILFTPALFMAYEWASRAKKAAAQQA